MAVLSNFHIIALALLVLPQTTNLASLLVAGETPIKTCTGDEAGAAPHGGVPGEEAEVAPEDEEDFVALQVRSGQAGKAKGTVAGDQSKKFTSKVNMTTEDQSKAFRMAWSAYNQMKKLRKAGFRCPNTGHSVPPNSRGLEFDCRLFYASLAHAQDMGERNYFDHISPEGTDPFDRTLQYGLPTFDENIYAGRMAAEEAMTGWKNSRVGHCRNMMNPAHNRVGVAYYEAPGATYRHYWAALYTNDGGYVDTSCYRLWNR